MTADIATQVFHAFDHPVLPSLTMPNIHGTDRLASCFDVTGLANATMGVAAMTMARLSSDSSLDIGRVTLDQRLTNLWFGMTLQPIDDWSMAAAWDSIAGDYQTQDGWIRLHTNAPHHKQAALRVLNCTDSRDAVAREVQGWRAQDLETAIVEAQGAAAQMRSIEDWRNHPQGRAVANTPLVDWSLTDSEPVALKRNKERPLAGIKVLDLTRVLAGPVATRFIAGHGAQVLRIDPLDWDEPGVVPEVTLGKRCAGLDLKTANGLALFKKLLKEADVLVHGYRADALARLGLDVEKRRAINPNLIDVSLNAYGWAGDWQNRRGFDSLMQMSTGIAHAGMMQSGRDCPTPLPVQALDHATGYLMAAAVAQSLALRAHGQLATVRCSLASTAQLLIEGGHTSWSDAPMAAQLDDFSTQLEYTDWGAGRRIRFPVSYANIQTQWSHGAVKLRTSPPCWLN